MKYIFTISLIIASALGQGMSQLPFCAITCAFGAISSAGCSVTDAKCLSKGIARYQSTRPTNVLILHNRPLLAEFVKLNPEKILYLENGGYYVKDIHNNVLAITADNLREELDTAIPSINAESLKITLFRAMERPALAVLHISRT
ncbi:uncharacterized protein N7473_006537 [Penicillium subrubescens]|uniref:uncharacterized protein n=1 Tax=Penicillium subrubescens TaxID=1316194 RepID=UPI0025453270|nr:uncharacterized protein N7473_006537 [Penicillium subrubescens]KAJ5897138.1 hypothetical protein N7473_006537 [Penicillium subrubescens]